MHRIPSELRSEVCLGESSTRMGDLLGSPRVAPIFFRRVVQRYARLELGSAGLYANVSQEAGAF